MLRRRNLARAIVGSLFVAALNVSAPAHADSNVEAVPTGWRLQDYLDGQVVIYYTGSPCVAGSLILSASAPNDSKSRLWSIILTARATGKPVGIFYVNNSGTCTITSFYLKEQ